MTIIFSFPSDIKLAEKISAKTNFKLGKSTIRNFPDGESYVRIEEDVNDQKIILIYSLNNPDEKIMALMFFAKTAKELGAKAVHLVAPYLGYMRMDKRFQNGEAITSNIFAEFLSKQIDSLTTIDPHLHRHKTLAEIYSIPCHTLHANLEIANWIKNNVAKPLLIGPDEESLQWVEEIAKKVNCPFVILKKVRHGDRDVEISIPQIEQYKNYTPILVDDIISTAQTMIKAVSQLKKLTTIKPICIGVHAVFADDAFVNLKNCGVEKIVTCNTIAHESNAIDVSDLIVNNLCD